MKEESQEVTNPDTQEVKTETTLVGTGEYTTVIFETESKDELESKCIELLNNYKATDFMPVDTLEYTTDLVWTTEGQLSRRVVTTTLFSYIRNKIITRHIRGQILLCFSL